MDKFVVSARKYRPARFDEVVGQESVTITLKNAIKSGALAHSFLFCGPRGVGKTTCARILAKTINCNNPQPDFEACNQCDACLSFNNNSSFNVHELDAASNNSVEDIRSLVDQVRFAPQGAKYKVYIIDEVHMLSTAAFNAFLKTLEEPPSYAVFILATTEKHKIIPTILSRCQIFDFNRITIDDIVSHLKGICAKEHIAAEDDALHVIAQKADGALRDALSMFDRLVDHTTNTLTFSNVITSLNLLDYDYFFKVTDYILSQDQTGLFLLFDQVIRHGFEGDNFLGGLMDHFRNLMVSKDPKTIGILEVSGELKLRYRQQAEQIPNSLLLNALNVAAQAEVGYKSSKNQRLHVELALLKMCYLSNVLKLSPETLAAEVKKNFSPDHIATASTGKSPSTIAEPVAPIASPEKAPSPTQPTAPEEKKIIKPLASNTVMPSLTGGSLGSLLSEPDNQPTTVEEPAASASTAQQIDQAAFMKAWNEITDQLTHERPSAHVLKEAKVIFEDDTVFLAMPSLSIEIFKPVRDRAVDYICGQMGLARINLELRQDKTAMEDKPRKAFTAREKFEQMKLKNPALGDLQNKLNLKLDD
ncbi:MAG: DNA polymerase III subunit gamma/tau [Chitinophagales bacterium]|nr:DNA polymerase III subunit gamma/tau [Chitinophagales bacterium]